MSFECYSSSQKRLKFQLKLSNQTITIVQEVLSHCTAPTKTNASCVLAAASSGSVFHQSVHISAIEIGQNINIKSCICKQHKECLQLFCIAIGSPSTLWRHLKSWNGSVDFFWHVNQKLGTAGIMQFLKCSSC